MKVVFVVGATASGKSQLAMDLAQKTQGAIVNCDSIQLYQGLEIGSAAPSLQDRALVPHYLYGVYSPGREATVGDYYRLFFETLEQIKNKYNYVYVVGGTGFYFQAIEKGLYKIGSVNSETIRALESQVGQPGGADELYLELQSIDPLSAKKISKNDHYRLVRAIEIWRSHGRSKTEIENELKVEQKPFPYPLLKIGMSSSREFLESRVRMRTQQMFDQGLLKEVQELLNQGLASWSALRSIGFLESIDYLQGNFKSMEDLKEEIVKNTLRLAKRQRTWFRRDPDIDWIDPKNTNIYLEKILSGDFFK